MPGVLRAPQDSLGIVEYGSDVKVTCPLTRCDAAGRERLKAAVEKIQISGLEGRVRTKG